VSDAVKLTDAQRNRLWTIAQHKYGWGYYSWRDWPSFEALERRGLVEMSRASGTDRIYALTSAGLNECRRRFPVSPVVLGTYDHQPGGWTPRGGVANAS
jgi:DNA-binding PadR family transcriptional regulator